MNQYLITFQAEYYCQGWEYAWFTKLVTANSYEEAVEKIKTHTKEWDGKTARYFKLDNL